MCLCVYLQQYRVVYKQFGCGILNNFFSTAIFVAVLRPILTPFYVQLKTKKKVTEETLTCVPVIQ